MILTRRWWKLQRWLTCINADDGDDTEGSKNCGKNVEDDDNNEGNEEDDGTDKDVEDDDLGDDADTAYLLLHEVEAHGDHGDAEEEVEGAEGDPGLAVLHLLVRGEVTEADGGQSDETEVGTGQRRGLGWNWYILSCGQNTN